jgi:hypothetical protein
MTVTHAGQVAGPAAHAGFAGRGRGWLRAAAARLVRWSRTPAAKAAGAPIGPAERVLTTDCDLAGSLVVATGAAVYYQDAGEPGRIWSRLGWEDVGGVGWDDRRCVLALTGVGPGGSWRKEMVLPSRTALVELAWERFTSTLLASTAVRLGDQVCAWVTARRQPGSGKVAWVVVLNADKDTGDPAIGAKVTAAIADLQAQTGISAVETAGAESRP